MNLSGYERETVINISDGDDVVRIWSAQRAAIGKMRRNPLFTEVKSGEHDGSIWAEFTIPANKFSFGAKRQVVMTEEQKAAAAARLAAARTRQQ